MPYFDGVSGPVYYKAWRVAEPIAAVVLLHGFGEHSGMYHRLGNALSHHQIDLWALDHVGHGLSYGERGNVESLHTLVEHGDRLLSLASSAGAPVYLMGHSLGSSVAAAYAASRGPAIAGLILSAVSFGPKTLAAIADTPPEYEMELGPDGCATDPFYLDELANNPLAFLSAPFSASTGAVIPAAAAAVAEDTLPSNLPVLLVHGTEDPIIPVSDAREVAGSLPNARLSEFRCLHDVLNDVCHAQVADTVVQFVGATVASQ